jgi:hypothetical protein
MLSMRLLFVAMLIVGVAIPTWADHSTLRNDEFNTNPTDSAGNFDSSFGTKLRENIEHEAAQTRGRSHTPFIFSGGTHATAGGFTSAAFATEAFVPERVNQSSNAIAYDSDGGAIADDVCWTIISSDNDGIAGWSRVGTTAYYVQCEGDTTPNQPSLPANSAWLMQITITTSAIATVGDLREGLPFASLPETSHGLTAVRYHEASGCYVPQRFQPKNDATLSAAITELNWDACILLPRTLAGAASGSWAIDNNLSIPARIVLKVEQGALLNIASGVVLTCVRDGCIQAGSYSVFGTGTGTVVGLETIKLEWLGALCDASTDDATAFQKANTFPTHTTVLLPNGRCVIGSTVTFTKTINLVGQGADSELFCTMGTGTNCIEIDNGSAAGAGTMTDGVVWRDFTIAGATASADYCAMVRNITRASFERVYLMCGTAASGYGIWVQDHALESYYNFIIAGSLHENPFGGVNYEVPKNGVKVTNASDLAGTFTVNTFNLDMTSVATGIHIFSAATGGNNVVSGSFQGMSGNAIQINGGTQGHIHNVHMECGTVGSGNALSVEDHDRMRIGPNVLSAACATGNDGLILKNCDRCVVDGYFGEDITIDSASDGVQIRAATANAFAATEIVDSGVRTHYTQPVGVSSALFQENGPHADGTSIVLNGDAERWTTTSTIPPQWGLTGTPTIAREGTIIKHGTYSIKVTGGDTTDFPFVGLIGSNALANEVDDMLIAYTAWVYVPTSGGNDVTVQLTFNSGTATAGGQVVSTRDDWVRVSGTFLFDDDTYNTVHLEFIPTASTTTFYVDAVSAVASLTGAPVLYTENPADRAGGRVSVGAFPNAVCTTGDMHVDTDETDDTNCTTTADNSLCLCTATDTWTALENN